MGPGWQARKLFFNFFKTDFTPSNFLLTQLVSQLQSYHPDRRLIMLCSARLGRGEISEVHRVARHPLRKFYFRGKYCIKRERAIEQEREKRCTRKHCLAARRTRNFPMLMMPHTYACVVSLQHTGTGFRRRLNIFVPPRCYCPGVWFLTRVILCWLAVFITDRFFTVSKCSFNALSLDRRYSINIVRQRLLVFTGRECFRGFAQLKPRKLAPDNYQLFSSTFCAIFNPIIFTLSTVYAILIVC